MPVSTEFLLKDLFLPSLGLRDAYRRSAKEIFLIRLNNELSRYKDSKGKGSGLFAVRSKGYERMEVLRKKLLNLVSQYKTGYESALNTSFPTETDKQRLTLLQFSPDLDMLSSLKDKYTKEAYTTIMKLLINELYQPAGLLSSMTFRASKVLRGKILELVLTELNINQNSLSAQVSKFLRTQAPLTKACGDMFGYSYIGSREVTQRARAKAAQTILVAKLRQRLTPTRARAATAPAEPIDVPKSQRLRAGTSHF